MSPIKALFAALFVLSLGACSRSVDSTAADVRVLDYGIYDAAVLLEGSSVLGQTPRVASVHGIKHRETTTDIPCQVGTFFGCRLDPATLPEHFELETKITHPPFAEPGGEPTTESIEKVMIERGMYWDGRKLWFFLEGFEYELVPGTWSVEIWVDELQVANFDFDVRKR